MGLNTRQLARNKGLSVIASVQLVSMFFTLQSVP